MGKSKSKPKYPLYGLIPHTHILCLASMNDADDDYMLGWQVVDDLFIGVDCNTYSWDSDRIKFDGATELITAVPIDKIKELISDE